MCVLRYVMLVFLEKLVCVFFLPKVYCISGALFLGLLDALSSQVIVGGSMHCGAFV